VSQKCPMILCWSDAEEFYQGKRWAAWGSNPEPKD
jgi:hypothetical protein